MGWMQTLYETYENACNSNSPVVINKLLKVAHSTQNAHIEILINNNGDFKDAKLVSKDYAETVIPVTESSASRSSGIAPHPLYDKLKYIAGDYDRYFDIDNSAYYKEYMTNLENWVNSNYNSPKVEAIYKYLSKSKVINDLIQSGIFTLKNGVVNNEWNVDKKFKMSAGNPEDAFVRFRVTGVDNITEVWKDSNVQNLYIDYYLSKTNDKAFCYITGKNAKKCVNHPSKIRNSGDKAKLISANDTSGFTFRGRFDDSEQAVTISYDASQKAHNMLKWLISNQGQRVGEKVFVLWGTNNENVPSLAASTYDFLEDSSGEFDTAEKIADEFNKAIQGYKADMANMSKLALIGLDAATTGRLSVIFYREYMGRDKNELINNIESWHRSCTWYNSAISKEGKRIRYEGAPSPISIARIAYGTEQNEIIQCDNKILANTVERLLPCISDGKKIPRDIVYAVVNKAMYPIKYQNDYNWNMVLETACSVYRKYLFDYKGEYVDMSVNNNCKDISYNCGRLLAVADAIERWALYDKEKGNITDEKGIKLRPTNAMRYYTRFAKRPCETWMIINERLNSYKQTLGDKGAKLYNLMGEISEKIDTNEFKNAKNLDGGMCLGFDSQRQSIIIERKKERENGGN